MAQHKIEIKISGLQRYPYLLQRAIKQASQDIANDKSNSLISRMAAKSIVDMINDNPILDPDIWGDAL